MKSRILLIGLAALLPACGTMEGPRGIGGNITRLNAYTVAVEKPKGSYMLLWKREKWIEEYPGMLGGWSSKIAAGVARHGLYPVGEGYIDPNGKMHFPKSYRHPDWVMITFIERSPMALVLGEPLQAVKVSILGGRLDKKTQEWTVEATVNGAREALRESVGRALDLAVPAIGTNSVSRTR